VGPESDKRVDDFFEFVHYLLSRFDRQLCFDAAVGVTVEPASEAHQGLMVLAEIQVHYLEAVSALHIACLGFDKLG
jgi:hypothetical protein